MTKTKEELNELKKEYEELTSKISELSKEEIEQIAGGFEFDIPDKNYENHIYEGKVADPDSFEKKF